MDQRLDLGLGDRGAWPGTATYRIGHVGILLRFHHVAGPFTVVRVGTLVPPKTLVRLRTRVHSGTFRLGNLRDPSVSGGFPRRSPAGKLRCTAAPASPRITT
ncbi:hypothetical protein GCM10010301_49720 [Streptomyces plicatus]|nr:hypothetical protein GCM10010301_49720 [Streptomyces plicatus]